MVQPLLQAMQKWRLQQHVWIKVGLEKMTSRYDDIRREARFCGTYQELRKIVAGEIDGTWQDLGLAKRFTSDDYEDDDDDEDVDNCESDRDDEKSEGDNAVWDMSIIWWSDTGDLLFSYSLAEYGYCDHSERREDKKRPRSGQRWKPLKVEKMRETSLPEMFFRDPIAFYDRYEKKQFTGDYQSEAAEIVRKARCIAAPRRLTKSMSVVHQFGPENEYRGFQIGSRPQTLERNRGEEVIAHCIDMRLPYTWNGGAKSGTDLLAVSLMREFDKTGLRVWDRKGCEEFFNAPELFRSY